jgi:hypothetical protein
MQMNPGETWRCTNANCRCEVLVEIGSLAAGRNPVCSCGALMKKPYAPPVLRCLEFLPLAEPVGTKAQGEE